MNRLRKLYYYLINKNNRPILEYIDYLESTPIIADIKYSSNGIAETYSLNMLGKDISVTHKYTIHIISESFVVNNEIDKVSQPLRSRLYNALRTNYQIYHCIIGLFRRELFPLHSDPQDKLLRIVRERFEEFNIISDGKLDVISLSSLYEFYNKKLDINKLRGSVFYLNTLKVLNKETNRYESLTANHLLCNE